MDKEAQRNLSKIKRRVLNKIPNAKLMFDYDGNCFVINDHDNLSKEYLLPLTNSELTAWKYALLSIQTTQNFNRTHPIRMDMFDIENKLERISIRRKRKNRIRI